MTPPYSEMQEAKVLIVHSKLTEILKFIDDKDDRDMIVNLLIKYPLQEVDMSMLEKRQCKQCNEYRCLDDFIMNQLANGQLSPGWVCKKCQSYNSIFTSIKNNMMSALPSVRGDEAGNRLRSYFHWIKNNNCVQCSRKDRHSEYYWHCPQDCMNMRLLTAVDDLVGEYGGLYSFTNYSETEEYLKDRVAGLITDEIHNVFTFYKEVKQKIYKLKKQEHETSKC
jgi:hypothetical protein